MVANHEYTAVDISWTIRSPYSNDLLDGGLRQTTFIPGVINLLKGFASGKKADKIGDQTGINLSHLDKVGSGIQIGYALSGIAGKVTSLWTSFRPNPTVAAIGTVIGKILGYIAIPLYAVPAITGAYQAIKAREFYKKYDATFKFLVESIYVQQMAVENLKYASQGNVLPGVRNFHALAQKELREQGFNPNTTTFDQAIKALDLTTYEEYYLSRYAHGQEDDLSVLGFLLAIKNKQEANEAEMSRAFGDDCVDLIKKSAMKGLEARLEAPDGSRIKAKALAELAAIRTKIEANYTQIQRINVTLSILSTLTVVLGCIAVALVITNPIGLIAIAAAWTLIALMWVVFDIYVAEQFEGRPGKYDKLLVKILTAVVLIGGALSIAGAAIAGSPVTLALAIVLLFLLLGYSAYTLHKIDKLEAKWLADHPTLKDLHKHLNDGKSHTLEETHVFFKKLNKTDRENITDQTKLEKDPPLAGPNAQYKFGKRYIKNFFKSQDTTDIVLLKRAAAKAANHQWTVNAYRNTDDKTRERALKLQEFRHALEDNRLDDAQTLYKAMGGPARKTLHTQITRVFKRDLTVDALSRATDRQIAAETPKNAS
jgi:hypothetical protein